MPEPPEEDGMPVMLGEVPNAFGSADPSLVKVDVMPETVAPKVQETVEQEMLTQEDEETVTIKPKAETKKEEVKKPEKRKKPEDWLKPKRNVSVRRRKRLPVNVWPVLSERERRWGVKVRPKDRVFRVVLQAMLRPVHRVEQEVMELLTSADVL